MSGHHVKDHFFYGGKLRSPGEGIEVELPQDRDSLVKRGLIAEGSAPIGGTAGELRTDGPTVSEYVAAGYRAENYPPHGFALRSSAEEIAAAIKAQNTPEPKAEPPADNKMKPAPPNKDGGGDRANKAVRT